MTWVHFLPALLKGAEVTASIAVISTALGAVLSFVIGVARVEGGPIISRIALVYIEFMRGGSSACRSIRSPPASPDSF
jgi:polar amino acid transport system permease protein